MWFGVEIFFEGQQLTDLREESLWEQRVVLLDAVNEAAVKAEAEQIGKESEHEYTTINGGRIRWVFQSVGNLHKVDADSVGDKTEVFSRFLRPKDVKSILTPFD
jgi:hypothetical protein